HGDTQRVQIHDATGIDRDITDLDTSLLERVTGIQDGVVFHGRGNDVVARLCQAEDSKIVAFGPTAGEDDFGRTASQERGYTLPGIFYRSAGVLAVMVDGRRIPELRAVKRPHRFEHLGQQRRRGVVVHVDAAHG